MIKLVILTDDLTGALDSGVQLSNAGIKTLVSLQVNFDAASDYEVLVIDLQSRHLSKEDAYNEVFKAASAAYSHGVQLVYKKVDSALRGNIGAELEALLKASGIKRLLFIPAYPKNDRITIGGVHWINGVKADESIFSRDPFEPVRHSMVADIIAEQSSILVETSVIKVIAEPVIEVLDAASEEDLNCIADNLSSGAIPCALAGCAGFAAYLPRLISFKTTAIFPVNKSKTILVISGSLNSAAIRQSQWAKDHGYPVFTLTNEQKLISNYWQINKDDPLIAAVSQAIEHNGIAIVETVKSEREQQDQLTGLNRPDLEMQRQAVQLNLAELTGLLLEQSNIDSLVIVGGDTLRGVLDNLGVKQIIPIEEIEPGVVISRIQSGLKGMYLVSKSGGFGQDEILGVVHRYLTQRDSQ